MAAARHDKPAGMRAARILFRADAALQIGTGHVMRCLTLADALREQGAACHFLCRPHPGHLIALIAARGHQVTALPPLPEGAAIPASTGYAAWLGTDPARDAADCMAVLGDEPPADWLVVDHYALDRDWERRLRPAARRVLVLDDLANRAHDCELLLDPGIGRGPVDYAGLIPAHARLLAGPEHALLRPEFAAHRAESLARRADPRLRRLLVTLGGVDKDNVTCQVLEALDRTALPAKCAITVVMGPHAPWLAEVQARAARMATPTRVLTGVGDMARLMSDSDLAIGAAGSTAWERCCLGLPSIQLVLAENQTGIAAAVAATGGAVTAASPAAIADLLGDWQATGRLATTLRRIGLAAAAVTTGDGIRHALAAMEAPDV